MSNWPTGQDLSHSNYTLRFPRVSKYDGMGAWEKDSSTPPWGWALAITTGAAVFALFLFGPTLAAQLIGV